MRGKSHPAFQRSAFVTDKWRKCISAMLRAHSYFHHRTMGCTSVETNSVFVIHNLIAFVYEDKP